MTLKVTLLKRMMRDYCVHLLVDTAVRRTVVNEDTDDVYISPPGSQVQGETTFAVSHVCGRLELEKLQHHLPGRETGTCIKTEGEMEEQK